jgi:FAD/FMN-containing dehydrogenase
VPITKIPEIILASQTDLKKLNLKAMIVGHVGDGNFHTFVSLNTNDPDEMKNFDTYSANLVNHALRLDGTCTGEHGIGLGTFKCKLKRAKSKKSKTFIRFHQKVKRNIWSSSLVRLLSIS